MTDTGALLGPFHNGNWIWDDDKNSLMFVSRDVPHRSGVALKDTPTSSVSLKSEKKNFKIYFRDITDKLEKLIFKRYFQRRVKPDEPNVITVQDLKDIALYMANTEDLTVEFIHYFHTVTVDQLLRALLVYFQQFLNICDSNYRRLDEQKRKLRQPIVTELEDVLRDDLEDIRALVAERYLALICGIEDSKQFHHMAGGMFSLSEKDRRLFEMLVCIAVRVVWIGLQRKHLFLIELEMNRMFRSDSFNIVTHRRNVKSAKRSAAEDRVLIGAANRFERTLLQRSPLVKELLFAEHDHRMLGVGVKLFQPRDDRIDFIEAAYSAPEELINKMGIAVGLLGIPREEFDAVLVSRERTSKTYTKQITEIPDFHLPPKVRHSYTELPNTFPKRPCRFEETAQTKRCRKTQCKMWARHVKSTQLGITEASSDKVRQDSASRISVTETKT